MAELPLLYRYLDKSGAGALTIDDFRRIVRKEAKISATAMSDEELLCTFGKYASNLPVRVVSGGFLTDGLRFQRVSPAARAK